MSELRRPVQVAVGDRVRFDGQVRGVLAVSALAVTLSDDDSPYRAVPLLELFGADGFEVLTGPARMPLPPVSLLETLPPEVLAKALWWEGHILEVLHGLPFGAAPGTAPRPEYAPGQSLTARQRVKAAELTRAGHQVTASAVGHHRRRYQQDGVLGLVDYRPVRKKPEFGEVDERVVSAMRAAVKEGIDSSTKTGSYFLWRTGEILRASEEGRTVKLPSRATLYRLLAKLTEGTHTFSTATTRRSKAHGAKTPFGELPAFAPGQIMQIDSTPMDVMVLLDDGVPGRIELTGMIDVATRTLSAAVLRPTTKSVDASVLLARTVTPELMRPGWAEALRMSRSVLPHRRLLSLDERLEHAAARPVIVPEMIVCDNENVFISRNFKASCRFLEIDFQPAHKGSGFEKGHIEKMLASIATLFVQFLPGHLGRSTDHRGRHPERERLWSLIELQELLDEWIVAHWQNRPHDGLRDPAHPSRMFTPNEKYATLVEACGYVPVALSGDDYVELLPAEWRAVNDYGIKIKHRVYDSPELDPLRRRNSGIAAKRGLWEVHRDPYDVSRIWVRDHRSEQRPWVQATWKHLHRAPVPFGDLAWDHVSHQLPGATEAEIADAVAAFLTRAHAGPAGQPKAKQTGRDRRVAARTKAAGPATPLPSPAADSPAAEPNPQPPQTEDKLADVIPLGLFDPLEDPWRRR
ncbi:Mu transposase C-terminal domain-containing protein [Kitasatospora sp. YST-16]|uniref:Mu transposase C-terminal domain-containing protein n=1 Tax=Kitasatospora sp. YST-16 TaxID=2998080 RepID=UPI002283A45E|nr:Mu transposase C-terminal domain-containing protein [Kitasatospora sp. YST-16]WAL75855.1 Mu transposase C-terminal domain-containing protein [Kitasatospora sp. YST-16]WNW41916.1 Mu transposase C-terminal domain-containing protein [Streptomyces sp. Li-HN-5-13]